MRVRPLARSTRALELGHLPDRQLAVGHPVLSDVGRRPFAFDDQRLHRLNAVFAAQRRRRVVDDLHLRRHLRARAGKRRHARRSTATFLFTCSNAARIRLIDRMRGESRATEAEADLKYSSGL